MQDVIDLLQIQNKAMVYDKRQFHRVSLILQEHKKIFYKVFEGCFQNVNWVRDIVRVKRELKLKDIEVNMEPSYISKMADKITDVSYEEDGMAEDLVRGQLRLLQKEEEEKLK